MENKANVNSKTQDNVTPLMDCCYVGSYECINILLRHNANINDRDSNGWSASDYLQRYITITQRAQDLTEEDLTNLSLLKTVLKQMRAKETKCSNVFKKQRGKIDLDNEDESDDFFVNDMEVEKSSRNTHHNIRRPRVKKEIASNENDDQPASTSKASFSKLSRGPRKSNPAATISRSRPEPNGILPSRKRFNDADDIDEIPDLDDDVETEPSPQSKKRKIATPDVVGPRDIPSPTLSTHSDKHEASFKKVPIPETCPEDEVEVPGPFNQESHSNSVVVDIENVRLRVLIGKNSTVQDLADQSSQFYYERFGRTPKLTCLAAAVDDSCLRPNDNISETLSKIEGSKVIKGIVESWNLPSFESAYERCCDRFQELQYEDFKATISRAELEGVLSLDNFGLARPAAVKPVIKAMKFQDCIRELTIAACKLGAEFNIFKMFCESISTLSSLSLLDVSNNALNEGHMKELERSIQKMPSLSSLNVSFNSLTDASAPSLMTLATNLNSMSVSSCYLTKNCFEGFDKLPKMKYFNVSYNRLGEIGIALIIDLVKNSDVIRTIDLCGVTQLVTPKIVTVLQDFATEKESQLVEIIFRHNSACRNSFASVPLIKT